MLICSGRLNSLIYGCILACGKKIILYPSFFIRLYNDADDSNSVHALAYSLF